MIADVNIIFNKEVNKYHITLTKREGETVGFDLDKVRAYMLYSSLRSIFKDMEE